MLPSAILFSCDSNVVHGVAPVLFQVDHTFGLIALLDIVL